MSVGCGLYQPPFIRTEKGKQAVKKSYSLHNKLRSELTLIDTSSIYLIDHEYLITNKRGSILEPAHTYYDFIRFSNTGTALFRSLMLEKPKNEDFNNLNRGQFCYFVMEGDIIKLEVYNFDTKIFEYRYGRIQKNGDILFYKKKGRPWWAYKARLNELFRKTPADLTTNLIFPE